MEAIKPAAFSPMPAVNNVADAIAFYQTAFGAIELRRWSNDDGSVHVAEMQIEDAMFHIHEPTPHKNYMSPETLGGYTTCIGLFVNDPDALIKRAEAAGAKVVHAQDFEYGYRQGRVTDPFGHVWELQKKI